jgi:hypothetical protein
MERVTNLDEALRKWSHYSSVLRFLQMSDRDSSRLTRILPLAQYLPETVRDDRGVARQLCRGFNPFKGCFIAPNTCTMRVQMARFS